MAKGKKTGGRIKGVPNKLTTDVKEAIVQAFDMVGGPEYLRTLATTNPTAFCSLLGKTIPVKVGGEEGKPVELAHTVRVIVVDPKAP